MKKIICSIFVLGLTTQGFTQQLLEDEITQARVYFMNDAKVSYVTSADVYQVSPQTTKSTEIPGDIQESFNEKYRGAKNVKWVIKEDRYKVNFTFKGNEMFTYLDRHGLWIKSFTKLKLKELPESVSSYLESYYSEYQLTKYYLKNTPNGHTYTIAVKGNDEYVWMEFDENGQVLNSTA